MYDRVQQQSESELRLQPADDPHTGTVILYLLLWGHWQVFSDPTFLSMRDMDIHIQLRAVFILRTQCKSSQCSAPQ